MEIERKTRPFLTANGDELQHCTCTSLSVQTHRDRLLQTVDGFPPDPCDPIRSNSVAETTWWAWTRWDIRAPHPSPCEWPPPPLSVNTCYCHRSADGDGWKPLPPWWRRARWLARFHTDEHIGQKWHFNELCPVLSAACRPLIAGWPRCALPSTGPARSIGWQIRAPWRQLISPVMKAPPATRRLVISFLYRHICGWEQNIGCLCVHEIAGESHGMIALLRLKHLSGGNQFTTPVTSSAKCLSGFYSIWFIWHCHFSRAFPPAEASQGRIPRFFCLFF